MKRFQRSRLRASTFSSSITRGGKCGSPDSARWVRYTDSAGRTISWSNSTSLAFSSSERALGAKSMPERLRARRCGRGEELDRWFGAVELRDRRDAQRVRGRAVIVGELARRHAELHGDPVGVVGIDGDAPAVIDAHRVGTVVEPALQAGVEVVEVGRVE